MIARDQQKRLPVLRPNNPGAGFAQAGHTPIGA